jgi:hypothetical protein
MSSTNMHCEIEMPFLRLNNIKIPLDNALNIAFEYEYWLARLKSFESYEYKATTTEEVRRKDLKHATAKFREAIIARHRASLDPLYN